MNRSCFTARTIHVIAATSALGVVAAAFAAPAGAHVHVDADHTAPGDDAVLAFEVPNESEKGATTTEVTVNLPDLTEVSAEQIPGWTARLERNVAAGTVKSITWTAAPGAGISPDQFAIFRVAVMLPTGDSASFPTIQTYSDGTVVRWDQPTLPGGAEPEHPSPTLTLGSTPHKVADPLHPSPSARPGSDTTSRWLAGSALAVAGASLVITVIRRRS